jgi:hypothetical protein
MKPILVTGAHRSGTTWVGKMLAASARVAYISEPLNVLHRSGVMRVPVEKWYTYICTENEEKYITAFRDTINFRYHPWLETKSIRSIKDFFRMWRDWGTFSKGRILSQIPLIKDPFAIYSTPWFADRLDCRVVIVVRHPAAVTSSLMRLGWNFDFRDLLGQKRLIRDWLEPYRQEMESLLNSPKDVLAQSSLLWKMIYQVVDTLREKIPDLTIVRHEDVSLDPLGNFEMLYQTLDLEFSQQVKKSILRSSSSSNPKEVSPDAVHSFQVDSRANLENWKQRLSGAEIQRVHKLTSEVAELYYSEQDWQISAST